jgi:hypothetical protein
MPKRRPSQASGGRKAGVYIEQSRVDVSGDLVGRDKVVIGASDSGLDQLFAHLESVIGSTEGTNAQKKQALERSSKELKAELQQAEPDLGKIGRLKEVLVAHGGEISAAVGAIFRYPAVQDVIKMMSQRLLGA